MRLVFADPVFGSLNGALVGMNSSVGESVGWANTYASFQKVYNNNNTDETTEETNLAKLSGGSVSFKLADCYSIKTK